MMISALHIIGNFVLRVILIVFLTIAILFADVSKIPR